MTDINSRVIEICKSKKNSGAKCYYELVSQQIKREFNVYLSRREIRGICERYRKRNGMDEFFKKTNEDKYVGDESTLTINDDDTKTSDRVISVDNIENITKDELLIKHGFNPSEFKIVNAKNTFWKNSENGNFYSSKITVAPRNDFSWNQGIIDKIFKDFYIPACLDEYKTEREDKNDKYLIIPLVDLHYNMFGDPNSGADAYNSKICDSIVCNVVGDILNRTANRKFEKIIIVVGNDLINCDNLKGTTTKGTPQDNCGSLEGAIIMATNMLMAVVDVCKKITKVDVVYVPSNHDKVVGYGIINAIRARYIYDDNIKIDFGYSDRKYHIYGNTLIGFAHEIDVGKVNDIVQSDARELISKTKRTVYLLAHLHHEETKDVNGTDVRRLSSVVGKSRWTYENGYNSVRKNISFVLDGENGITDTLYSFV